MKSAVWGFVCSFYIFIDNLPYHIELIAVLAIEREFITKSSILTPFANLRSIVDKGAMKGCAKSTAGVSLNLDTTKGSACKEEEGR